MKKLSNLFFTAIALALSSAAQADCPETHKVKFGDIGFKLNSQDELNTQTGSSLVTPFALREDAKEKLNNDPRLASIPTAERLGAFIVFMRSKREKDRGEKEKSLYFASRDLDPGKVFKSVSVAPLKNVYFFDFIVDRPDLKRPLYISFTIPNPAKVGKDLDILLSQIAESACQD
jgi:hypothetical protein